MSNTKKLLNRWWSFRLRIYLEGAIVGLLAGLVVVGFRFAIELAEKFRVSLYAKADTNPWQIALICILLLLIGWLLGQISTREPMSSGSGIPQVKGILVHRLKMNWLRVLLAKFAGGVLAIGAGLSLGREGPSIQLGAAIGQGLSRALGRLRIEEKYLLTAGASAGLAAAFNAPLAGVMFALEELHKNFAPAVLGAAMVASITADFVSQNFFGQQPVFRFHDIAILPLRYYAFLLVLGVVVGVLGVLFNHCLTISQNQYAKITWLPKGLFPLIPLGASLVLGLYLPQVLGGGHQLVEHMATHKLSLTYLLILLVGKFLFTMVSYGSGTPGGIFLPLLVIGALIGDFYGLVTTQGFGLEPHYAVNFLVLAMAGYFTAITKAPITGTILITEMTGSFEHLLPLIIVSVVAYLVSEVLKSEPIYDMLLHRLTAPSVALTQSHHKLILEVAIQLGSPLAHKRIKDIVWPTNCLLVAVRRGEMELIPKGNTRLSVGDYLIALTGEDTAAEVKGQLLLMAEEG